MEDKSLNKSSDVKTEKGVILTSWENISDK